MQLLELKLIRSLGRNAWRAVLMLILLGALTATCPAQTTNILETPITRYTPSYPLGITYGPDGAYWFTEYDGQAIGRIDPSSNAITEVLLTNNPMGEPESIVTLGTNLWFTESFSNILARLTPNTNDVGDYQEFALPNISSTPIRIMVGSDSNLWFIEFKLNRIAAVDPNNVTNPSGVVQFKHETVALNTNSQIYGLTVGPDGRIWFTEGTYGVIGSFDPNVGTNVTITNITTYQLPDTNCAPSSLATGGDGALWFTEYIGNKIGRITTNGVVQEFPLPVIPSPSPYGIIKANDGTLWFTELNGSTVGSINTNGTITLFPTPTQPSAPWLLATGPDGNIWFTENPSRVVQGVDDSIGVIYPAQALSLTAPPIVTFPSPNNATYSNNLLATFLSSYSTNSVDIAWGDGSSSSLSVTGLDATNNPSLSVTNVVTYQSTNYTNVLTVSNTVDIATNNFTNGTFAVTNGVFTVSASHTYAAVGNYFITLTVTDYRSDVSTANIELTPAFFAGSVPFSTGVNFLHAPGHALFGYYSMMYFPYVYHFDLGYEYFVDANDGQGDAYFYDFTSGHWWYTGPQLFPFIYDFGLHTPSWLYYSPNTNTTDHYTTNPRWFYDFATSTWTTNLTTQ